MYEKDSDTRKLHWDNALEKVRSKLSDKMMTQHGLQPDDDYQVVRWSQIESVIDELKYDE